MVEEINIKGIERFIMLNYPEPVTMVNSPVRRGILYYAILKCIISTLVWVFTFRSSQDVNLLLLVLAITSAIISSVIVSNWMFQREIAKLQEDRSYLLAQVSDYNRYRLTSYLLILPPLMGYMGLSLALNIILAGSIGFSCIYKSFYKIYLIEKYCPYLKIYYDRRYDID